MNWNPFKRSKAPEAKTTTNYGGASPDFGDGFITERPLGRAYSLPYLDVDERAARNSSIVSAIVWWGMRNIVQPLPRVMEEQADGSDEPIPGHPCSVLVRKPQAQVRPKDRTAFNYRRLLRAVLWSLMFDGNGYLLKVRNGQKVIGLDWIPHNVVKVVERDGQPAIIERYELNNRVGSPRKLDPSEVLHFTWGIDQEHPAVGCSPLKALMRMVMTDNQIAVFSHAVLRNPFPGLVVTPGDKDQQFEKEDLDLILKQIAQVSGGERGGGIAAFTDLLKVEKVGYSPDDMAIRELSKLPEERICAVFGIPPIVLQLGSGLERSTFNNMRQAFEAATEQFLVPIWEDMSEVFTESLLPEFDDNQARTFRLDYSQVKSLQEDQDALHKRAREDFTANLIDRAKALAMVGADPGPEDVGVYAYQLRPAPTLQPDMGQGKAAASAARTAAENAV